MNHFCADLSEIHPNHPANDIGRSSKVISICNLCGKYKSTISRYQEYVTIQPTKDE